MLKKEFKDVIKQTASLFLLLILVMFAFYLRSQVSDYQFRFLPHLRVFYELFILLLSFFYGISLFSSEASGNGFEYLLTFPLSRSRILFFKLVPRMVMLVLLYMIYLSIYLVFSADPLIMAPVNFTAVYFAIFLISTSLSPLKDNFVANSIVTFFLIALFVFVLILLYMVVLTGYYGTGLQMKLSVLTWDLSDVIRPAYLILISFILSFPFLISLFFAFKKFDIRGARRYLRRFVLYFIPVFAVAAILGYFIIKGSINAHHYYGYCLTTNGKIIQDTYFKNYVYDGKTKKEIRGPIYWYSAYEDENYLWSIKNNSNSDTRGVYRLNKNNLKLEKIYTPKSDEKIWFRGPVYGFKEIVAAVDVPSRIYKSEDKAGVVFINKKSLNTRRIELLSQSMYFCGVSESNGKRTWIGYVIRNRGVAVYSVNEDGRIKKIVWSEKYPVYINNYLLTYRDGNFIFGTVSKQGYEEFKRLKIDKEYYFQQYLGFRNNNLENPYMRYIYGKKRYQQGDISFIRIDMEKLETKILRYEFAKQGFLGYFKNGDTIFIRFTKKDPNVNGIFRFEGDDLVPLKIFEKENFEIWKDFSILRNGFMIRKKQKKIFYTYPGLKKLKFKGL